MPVRLLRGELQVLQEPGSYVGEVVKVMGKKKVLVKVQPEGGSVLTTQLFFPGIDDNESDAIFDEACLMEVSDVGNGQAATFDFVVEA